MANIGINTATAKEIHKEYMRRVRKPLLESLDIEYQKAQETIMKIVEDIKDPSELKGKPGIGTTILTKLEENKGNAIWKYPKDHSIMHDRGKELEILVDVPFEFIAV